VGLGALLLAIALPREAVVAQTDATRAALRLTVTADSLRPVVDAEVALSGQGRAVRVRTDSSGRARFEGLPDGLFRVVIRRVGFSPATVELRLGLGENALSVRLDRSVATLDEVRIVANLPIAARLDEFEMRKLRGDASHVITRDEIERRGPIALSQMLRGIGGIRIADSLGAIVAISTRGNKASPGRLGGPPFGLVYCVLRVTVDGVVLPSLSNIDAVVPGDVYGVEIFNGPSRVPVQFAGLRTDNFCGLIAIWTRDR
jgi:hypothetical protein